MAPLVETYAPRGAELGDIMPTKISCREAGFDCAFELQSEDETEVIEFTRRHAESTHDMALSRADVEELLQTV